MFTTNYTPTITAVTVVLLGILYLGSLVFDRDIRHMWYILNTAYSLFLKLKFPKILKYKRTSVCYATKFPSSGLRFSVDCSLLFYEKLLVFSAIQLLSEYVWLLNKGAWLFTKLLLRQYCVTAITMREIALWMAYLKTKIPEGTFTISPMVQLSIKLYRYG